VRSRHTSSTSWSVNSGCSSSRNDREKLDCIVDSASDARFGQAGKEAEGFLYDLKETKSGSNHMYRSGMGILRFVTEPKVTAAGAEACCLCSRSRILGALSSTRGRTWRHFVHMYGSVVWQDTAVIYLSMYEDAWHLSPTKQT
jgi:hypothetical protein